MAAAAVVIAPMLGLPGAQAAPAGQAPPATALPGYAPEVAAASVAALAEREGLSREDAVRRLASQPARIELGERLVAQLGSRSGGMWLDQAGNAVVVNVLDEADASTVRAAGARARVVERSLAQLESIRDTLAAVQVTDTAVGIDIAGNQVQVRVGTGAAGSAALAGMLATAKTFGDAVRVEQLSDTFSLHTSGGLPIFAVQGNQLPYCTFGFATTNNAGLTAGHCTSKSAHWWDRFLRYYGPTYHTSFPGNDFGLILNWGLLTQPGDVYLYDTGTYQDIATAAWPVQGMYLCKSGVSTRTACGRVLALNQTVYFPDGRVDGLASSDVMTAMGDSGGPWFAGNVGIGLTSGTDGRLYYFQPVMEALIFYGLQLL